MQSELLVLCLLWGLDAMPHRGVGVGHVLTLRVVRAVGSAGAAAGVPLLWSGPARVLAGGPVDHLHDIGEPAPDLPQSAHDKNIAWCDTL